MWSPVSLLAPTVDQVRSSLCTRTVTAAFWQLRYVCGRVTWLQLESHSQLQWLQIVEPCQPARAVRRIGTSCIKLLKLAGSSTRWQCIVSLGSQLAPALMDAATLGALSACSSHLQSRTLPSSAAADGMEPACTPAELWPCSWLSKISGLGQRLSSPCRHVSRRL